MRKYLLGLVVPLSVAIALLHVASRAKASETEELNSCPVSGGDLEDELESAFHDATEVIINCISVDEVDGVRNGVVSVFYMEISNASSMTSARFSLECTGSLLKILPSERPATNATVSCAEECAVEEEQDNLCPTACDQLCTRCYGNGPASCTRCKFALLDNGTCTDCVYGRPDSSGLCVCEDEFTGELCSECQGVIQLANYTSPVPGYDDSHSQATDSREHESKDFSDGKAGRPREFVFEEGATCQSDCTDLNYEPVVATGICYACGIEFCLECSPAGRGSRCSLCRPPLVPNSCEESKCITVEEFSSSEENVECIRESLEEVAEEQREELEHELEEKRSAQLTLAISLPIVCSVVVVFCVLMSVVGHRRYPHLNYKGTKRHRRNTLQLPPHEMEHVWRSQPSIRIR